MNIEIIIFFLIINYFIFKKISLIAHAVNIYDFPSKRKIHKAKTPLIGGVIFIINLIFFIFSSKFYDLQKFFLEDLFINNSEIFIFLFFSILIFFVGVIDDKFDMNPYIKLTLLSILIYIFLKINSSSVITELTFSFLDESISLGRYSYFFTTLCFLLFINSANMFDGINLQSGTYFLIFILVLTFMSGFSLFFLVIMMSLINFLFLNVKGKVFMGDSGIFIYSFMISFLSIKFYNLEIVTNVEIIFILMMVPGIDMFRMFMFRILEKKSPFRPDNLHIHHLLLEKFGYLQTIIILNFIILIPLLAMIIGFNNLSIIILYILFYIYFLRNLNFRNK